MKVRKNDVVLVGWNDTDKKDIALVIGVSSGGKDIEVYFPLTKGPLGRNVMVLDNQDQIRKVVQHIDFDAM